MKRRIARISANDPARIFRVMATRDKVRSFSTTRWTAMLRASASSGRRVAPWLSIRNQDDETKPVELLIYDQIGKDWFDDSGVDAKTFAQTLQDIPARRDILVCINSPGGNVWDGLAIYHQLQTRKERVTTRVDGIAASIASVIALAGRETRMPKNALMMIHDPSGLVIGTSADMRQLADELDKHADVLADIYATKSGTPAAEWRRKMRDETWFTGAEAKAAGLSDTVTDEVSISACFDPAFKFADISTQQPQPDGSVIFSNLHIDLSRCRRVPAALQHLINHTTAAARAAGQTTGNTMNRTLILALLKKHGSPIQDNATDDALLAALETLVTAGKITDAEKTALASQPPAPPAAAASAAADSALTARLDRAETALRQERERRLTAEVDALITENPAIDRAEWLPRVLADESLMASLRKFPKPMPGADPIRPSVHNYGNPLLAEYDKKRPGAERRDFRLRNFEAIQKARREFAPRAVNTLDAALVTDWLADGLVITAAVKLAALAGFSRDFSLDPIKPRATIQVRKALSTGATQTNPTNFEIGDSVVDNIPVTVNQISRSFHITNNELQSGHRLEHLAQINANTFVHAISDVWTALILAATYPGPLIIGSAAIFDAGVLASIYAAAKNFRNKNLILDGAYIGRILTQINPQAFKQAPQADRGAFGFDMLDEQNRWTGADANTVGIVCAPDAIAVAAGLPISPPQGEFLSLSTITLEGLGLSVQSATWYSRAGRVMWASYDVMFGAAAGDETQLDLLKSA
jgi:ATP-dependent Clp endopeptidase proteolytic subunit ClpP